MILFEHMYDLIAGLFDSLLDPRKRVFAGYLLSAFVIALVAVALRRMNGRRIGVRAGLKQIFDPAIWAARSARADYLIIFINRAIMMVIAPRLLTQLALATALFFWLHEVFAGRPLIDVGNAIWVIALCFTIVQFVLSDLSKYILHLLMHKVPALWAFHRVHHTAEVLTPFTVYRTHPVEGVLFALRSALVQATTISSFVFFFGNAVDLVTVLGVNVFLFAFNAAGSNLRHSHISIRFSRRVEKWLISPAQHQIHHSIDPRHIDRNFGAVLAIWDRMGRSLVISKPQQKLVFGVTDAQNHNPHSLYAIYVAPFVQAGRAALTLAQAGLDRSFRMFQFIRHSLFRRGRTALLALALASAGVVVSGASADADELDIYSHRQPFLIQPFVDAFTQETGVKVNIVYASKGLAQRLQIEGRRSPADLVLTVDIARLSIYADKDLLLPVQSQVLQANIPANLRDPGNRWFGLSLRARTVAVARERVAEGSIQRIEDLAKPEWQGRICTRPGSHVYNRALLASIIAADGEAAAETWARGLVSNLARRPQGNDRAQIKAIHEGVCDVAIINHYYFGKLVTSESAEHRDWAKSVRLVFTNQQDRGNHVNISGGGVARHANNVADAVRFLEFLTGETAQKLYGSINTEYPVNPAVDLPDDLAAWGRFRQDSLPIARISELAPTAQRIIDRTGW